MSTRIVPGFCRGARELEDRVFVCTVVVGRVYVCSHINVRKRLGGDLESDFHFIRMGRLKSAGSYTDPNAHAQAAEPTRSLV